MGHESFSKQWSTLSGPPPPAVRVFPNPARRQFTVEWFDFQPGATYQLFDTRGQLHRSGALNANTTTVPTAQLPAGWYLLRLRLPKTGFQNFKLVVVPGA